MSVVVHLPVDTEAKLREKAAMLGQDLAEYVGGLVESWAEANGAGPVPAPIPDQQGNQWLAAWRSWARIPRPATPLADDSRESIYSGRGE